MKHFRVTQPIPDSPYHGKTDDELEFIIQDAGEAARCMRDVDPVAEGKYLDQINDACTVLNFRRGFELYEAPARGELRC